MKIKPTSVETLFTGPDLRPAREASLRSQASHRGGALVVSLVFIVLIAIVLVGFVTTAGLERSTVQSHLGRVQADLYGSMAADVVASKIVLATSSTNSWWASQPGRIASTLFGNNPTTTLVDLHSGTAAAVQADVSVNLNPASLTQGAGVVAGDPAIILPVKWIYIRKDGSQEVAGSGAPIYDKANPWVGRYAYWTDDESARIDLNTASTSYPSEQLDLTTLTPLVSSDVQKIKDARALRPFNSVEEIKSVDGLPFPLASALTANKTALTHYNHSSDLNRFGEPRIVLTTQASVANGQPYFDILTTNNTDPGIDGNLDPTKIKALFAKLYSYFGPVYTAAKWGLPGPVTSNKTLAMKYTDVGAAQLIINLIDYVRSVESSSPLILPLRGAFYNGTFTYGQASSNPYTGNYGDSALRGNSRRLHIVEMSVFVPNAPPTGQIKSVTLKVKLLCDKGIDAGAPIDLTKLYLQYDVISPTLSSSDTNHLISNSDIVEADKTIGPGEYRTLSVSITLTTPLAARPVAATILAMRLAIKTVIGNKKVSFDIAPLRYLTDPIPRIAAYVQYELDSDAIAEADISSLSTGDPVINQNRYDWQQRTGNSFGAQTRPPASSIGTVPDPYLFPQQDTDGAGNITDVGASQPSVKGSAANPDGLIGSVGELGVVHSGGKGSSLPGSPWRTIRLQPRVNNGVLPDWLLLDLFTAPMATANPVDAAILRPADGTMAGRIGLNAVTVPFSPAQFDRKTPLKTLLRTVKSSLTDIEADGLAENILNQTLATGPKTQGTAFGTTAFTDAKLYPMRGEICEVKGIADDGEASEALARELVGRLTTQSNVFSVFAVAEKIQQLPNGNIKVTGQTQTRSLLERYQDGSTLKVRTLATTELGL